MGMFIMTSRTQIPNGGRLPSFYGHINASQPILYPFPHPDLQGNGNILIFITLSYYFAHSA